MGLLVAKVDVNPETHEREPGSEVHGDSERSRGIATYSWRRGFYHRSVKIGHGSGVGPLSGRRTGMAHISCHEASALSLWATSSTGFNRMRTTAGPWSSGESRTEWRDGVRGPFEDITEPVFSWREELFAPSFLAALRGPVAQT